MSVAITTSVQKVLRVLTARAYDVAQLQWVSGGRLQTQACQRSVRAISRVQSWRMMQLIAMSSRWGMKVPVRTRPTLRVQLQCWWLRGDDRRIMSVLHNHQQVLIAAFDDALRQELPLAFKNVLQRHRMELIRHGAWLSHHLVTVSPESRRTPVPPRRRVRSQLNLSAGAASRRNAA